MADVPGSKRETWWTNEGWRAMNTAAAAWFARVAWDAGLRWVAVTLGVFVVLCVSVSWTEAVRRILSRDAAKGTPT